MTDIVFSLPEDLITELDHIVPSEQRDQFVAEVLRKALAFQEQELYACALAVEQDAALHDELRDWDATLTDGIWHTRDEATSGI